MFNNKMNMIYLENISPLSQTVFNPNIIIYHFPVYPTLLEASKNSSRMSTTQWICPIKRIEYKKSLT